MRGIRIYSDADFDAASPSDGSTFALFFAPILPKLAAIHWLYDTFPFGGWQDTDCETAIADLPNNDGYIAPDTLLPRFARYVSDDWSSLFGFQSLPDIPGMFGHIQPRDYEFISQHVALCIFSIDGAFWDFYAHDETLLSTVQAHASSLPHVQVEQVDFSNFDM